MTDNLTFTQRVRGSKLLPKQPTQKEFSIEKWRSEFLATALPSDADIRLYEAGLWFDRRFREVRAKLSEIPAYKDRLDNLIRFQVGAFNFLVSSQDNNFFTQYNNVNPDKKKGIILSRA